MKIDALLEMFSDEKWTKMSTTREGVAREAPKNILHRRLLMVSRFLGSEVSNILTACH